MHKPVPFAAINAHTILQHLAGTTNCTPTLVRADGASRANKAVGIGPAVNFDACAHYGDHVGTGVEVVVQAVPFNTIGDHNILQRFVQYVSAFRHGERVRRVARCGRSRVGFIGLT